MKGTIFHRQSQYLNDMGTVLRNISNAYKGDSDRCDGTMDDKFQRKFALYIKRYDQNSFDQELSFRGFLITLIERAN